MNIILFLFTFFFVFCFQFNNVFISNVFFIALFLIMLYSGKIKLRNGIDFFVLALFLISIFISTTIFFADNKNIESSDIISLIFSFQYILFGFYFSIDSKKFEKYLNFCAILFSLYVIFFFVFTGTYMKIDDLYTTERMWGEKYIPGWPNTSGFSLLIALFFAFINKRKMWNKLLFTITLFMFTSRIAMLGAIIIWLYFGIKKLLEIKNVVTKISIISIATVSITLLVIFVLNNDSLMYRLSVFYDRENIFEYSISVIAMRPLFGYGGNSLDYIYYNVSSKGALLNWGHSHNTILEICIRYGIVTMILFLVLMIILIKKTKSNDMRFMILFLLGISLFQIYIRNFNFIFIICYLSNRDVIFQKNYRSVRNEYCLFVK